MAAFKDDVPSGFANPTALPSDSLQGRQWQDANRSWWESHPMRYDWKARIDCEEFTKEFYTEIDNRVFSGVREYMPWKKYPFDSLITFESLQDKDVLEIGVGNGSHAQLLARHARSFTGIDITDYAVRSTSGRMQCLGLDATIRRMDAEQMDFADNSFDFIWTWGVIHHSANTRRVLQEMHRVLRPGGQAVTMVYHRTLWNYYIMGGLFLGIVKGDLLRTKSLHKSIQRWTDGAIARYYSEPEWRTAVADLFHVENILVFGSKAEILPLPGGKLKTAIMAVIPDKISRFLTNRCAMGSFLVSMLRKTA